MSNQKDIEKDKHLIELEKEEETLLVKLEVASKAGNFDEFVKLNREYSFLSNRIECATIDLSSNRANRERRTFSKAPQISNNKPRM